MLQRQEGTVAPLQSAKFQDFMDDESIARYEEYIEEQMKHAEDTRTVEEGCGKSTTSVR